MSNLAAIIFDVDEEGKADTLTWRIEGLDDDADRARNQPDETAVQ